MSVRDIILAKPSEDIAELAGLINSSPRRRRMQELQLDDLQHLLQVSQAVLCPEPLVPPYSLVLHATNRFQLAHA